MAVTSALMTVAEFSALPQPQGGVRQELHHGDVFEMAPVKLLHTIIQKRLVSLLEPAVGCMGLGVDKEFTFRPLPEHQVWLADVALYRLEFLKQMSRADYYHGVPEVVIEVLSPSNTASEMLYRETIKVVQPAGRSRVFGGVDVVSSPAFGVSIAVGDIFAD